jgi:hypothetical protein
MMSHQDGGVSVEFADENMGVEVWVGVDGDVGGDGGDDVVDVDQSRFDKTMKLIVVIGMGQFVLLAVGMSLNVFVVVVDVVDVGIEGVEMKMVMVDVDYC